LTKGTPARTSLRVSVALSFGSSYITTIITLIVSIILARFFLTPHEQGIFSVVLAAVLFLQAAQDLGVSRYLVQEAELTKEKIESCLLILVLTSMMALATVLIFRNMIADFFGEPDVAHIFLLLTPYIVLIPWIGVGNALLRRASEFPRIFVMEMSSTIFGAIVGLSAAYIGEGAAALAYLTIAQAFLKVVLIVVFRPELLTYRPSAKGLRPILEFGSATTAVSLYFSLVQRLPEPILGRYISMTAAGLYGRAASISEQVRWALYTGGVAAIAPEISRRHARGESLVEPFLKLTAYATGLMWPVAGFIAVLSEPVTVLIYGEKWREMGPMLAYLAVAQMILGMIVLYAEILTLNRRLKLFAGVEIGLGTLGVFLLIIGTGYGPNEAALSRIPHAVVYFLAYLWILKGLVGHSFKDLAAVYLRSAVATLITLVPAFTARALWEKGWFGEVPGALYAAALSFPFWYLGIRVARHPLARELEDVGKWAKRMIFFRNRDTMQN